MLILILKLFDNHFSSFILLELLENVCVHMPCYHLPLLLSFRYRDQELMALSVRSA
jgi:hypothetical protein